MDRRTLEARGLLVTNGLIDLHAHLREPGSEDSETIATGAAAALRGGFTTVCAMPNTDPAIDSPGLVAEVIARARAARGARVLPIAAITRGRGGRELADLMELAAAGAVAFSDDGSPVDDPQLFRHALEYARASDLLLIEHPEDRGLSRAGVMHEGAVSARLGLPGIPSAAEETAVARGIALARLTGARLHLTHLSTAGSIELVRQAKRGGASITCDVTPHHLAMTDAWVAGSRAFAWENGDSASMGDAKLHRADRGDRADASASSAYAAAPYDSNTKMNPPLRTDADVRALWAGLADGTVDAIATDHAPHASTRKEVEFDRAANGISGLETALSLVLGGVAAGWCAREVALRALCQGPARILGIAVPAGDWIAIDPEAVWRPTAADLVTRGKNTPLLSRELRGRVVAAAVDDEVRFDGGVGAAV